MVNKDEYISAQTKYAQSSLRSCVSFSLHFATSSLVNKRCINSDTRLAHNTLGIKRSKSTQYF